MDNGTVLRGRWEIESHIGKGGFGDIYVARDIETNRKVAVKTEDKNAEKRVLNLEIDVLRSLQCSPYTAQLIHSSKTPKHTYFVMELLGDNLATLRRRYGTALKFSLATLLRISIHILRCIRYVHVNGFIHRDIKPSNFCLRKGRFVDLPKVLIRNYSREKLGVTTPNLRLSDMDNKLLENDVVIIDFGLSRNWKGLDGKISPPRKRNVGFRGTVRYASLNSHLGRELSFRDDLWSFFYMLVEFSEGFLPWNHVREKSEAFELKKLFHEMFFSLDSSLEPDRTRRKARVPRDASAALLRNEEAKNVSTESTSDEQTSDESPQGSEKDSVEASKEFLRAKRNMSSYTIKLRKGFKKIFDYIDSLGYSDFPDYDRLEKMIVEISQQELGLSQEELCKVPYDWETAEKASTGGKGAGGETNLTYTIQTLVEGRDSYTLMEKDSLRDFLRFEGNDSEDVNEFDKMMKVYGSMENLQKLSPRDSSDAVSELYDKRGACKCSIY